MKQHLAPCVLALLLALTSACGADAPLPTPTPTPTPTPPPTPLPTPTPTPIPMTAFLAGAGDIADCNNNGGRPAEETARLLDQAPQATIFAAGELAYFSGTAAEFANCYGPRWGRHKSRTRPAVGNHEYESPGAGPYYNYFGAAAGPSGLGYYSYELGNWHIVVLNSNIPSSEGSEQLRWLREDLTSHKTACALAYWHHPRFTSGPSTGNVMLEAWRVLYEHDVDVVINGHDHIYERFAPQDPDGRSDPAKGITEFVAGTGGAPLYSIAGIARNSVIREIVYGILILQLDPTTFGWTFKEATNEVLRDSGRVLCH